jgi:hypothetical protein
MWHLSAYSGTPAGTTSTQVNGLADGILRVGQTNGFTIPSDMLLLFGMALCSTMQRAFFSSPRILQTNPQFIRPTNLGLQPLLNPNVAWWGPGFVTLRGLEDVLFFGTEATGGNPMIGLIAVSPMLEAIPAGEIYTINATSTTTAGATAWTQAAYTLTQALPFGTYAMVGSQVSSATAVAHRWTFPGQYWRSGFPSNLLETSQPWEGVLDRRCGKMGQFPQSNLPLLEVLCTAGDTSHQIYMDLVKIG